jgi:2-hydroxy-4-carboxymuconate semialdehyde hemiacetal dehydrogenase
MLAPTRIALVGYGAIADLHAHALRQIGGITCVVGPDPRAAAAFAARHGIERTFTDLRSCMAGAGVDAVVIASPSGVHARQTREALSLGLHVLCEVPLALNADEALELVRLADAQGLVLGICQTLRYYEPLRVAKELAAGTRVLSVVARDLSLRIDDVGWTGRGRTWTDDLLWHHGGHVIDAVLSFMGTSSVLVSAAAGLRPRSDKPKMDYAICLSADTGSIASIALSYNARVTAGDYLVLASDQTIHIHEDVVETDAGVAYPGHQPDQDLLVDAVDRQDADFLLSIQTGTTMMADSHLILPAIKVLQKVADAVGDGAIAGP